MSSIKQVQFIMEVKNLTITSGVLQVGGANHESSMQQNVDGNTVKTGLSYSTTENYYYYITFLVKSYTLNNVSYNVGLNPINLMATVLVTEDTDVIKVCPESTIASAYAFGALTNVSTEGMVFMVTSARSIKIAYGIKQNLYKTEGVVADMFSQSPNGFETNSYSMFNSLCNLFYYCLTNPKLSNGTFFYDQFLEYTCIASTVGNFIRAILNMVHNPCNKAREIYEMIKDMPEIYKDSLTTMQNVPDDQKAPHNWTLTLKSNSSGAKNFIPAGAAFVVFDADDNAWVANNFRAGTNTSGTHCPVYKYDATPADFSPVQGGGLLGVAFGAAIDPSKEYISFGNFGWGPELNNPQEGSISRFYKDGTVVSPSNGFTFGLSRVQGMEYDQSGNLWMASVGCQDPFAPSPKGLYQFDSQPSAVVVYLNGDQTIEPTEKTTLILDTFPVKKTSTSPVENIKTQYLKVFDVTIDRKGIAYVSCIGNYDKDCEDNCALSAVYKVAIENNTLVVKASWYSDHVSDLNGQTGYESLRQVAVNAMGDVIVVGITSSRATVLDNNLQPKQPGGLYYDTNTNAPWGIKIDRAGTVFLANFGEEKETVDGDTLDMVGPFGVTMLRNPAKPETAVLLTVPTGGAEVTLANGKPLYGTQTRPVEGKMEPVELHCYEPIMRLTSTNIDGAGNLWCMNNWKPSAAVDVVNNPGGDGVVLFLGIANPE